VASKTAPKGAVKFEQRVPDEEREVPEPLAEVEVAGLVHVLPTVGGR
jgi:hypothetical protein